MQGHKCKLKWWNHSRSWCKTDCFFFFCFCCYQFFFLVVFIVSTEKLDENYKVQRSSVNRKSGIALITISYKSLCIPHTSFCGCFINYSVRNRVTCCRAKCRIHSRHNFFYGKHTILWLQVQALWSFNAQFYLLSTVPFTSDCVRVKSFDRLCILDLITNSSYINANFWDFYPLFSLSGIKFSLFSQSTFLH